MRRILKRHALAGLLLIPLLTSCSGPKNALERVIADGELRVLTRNAATTYYEGPNGPTGLEYALAKGFADELGVRLHLIIANNVSDIFRRLKFGEASFAAAGLTVTDRRRAKFRFTPPYQTIHEQLIYRLGTPDPANLGELNGPLEVMAGSSHEEHLRRMKSRYPDLSWVADKDVESEELLTMVWQQSITYTVADSNEVQLNQRYYPELRVAFNLGKPQQLAWAFPKGKDDSLYRAASAYFNRLKRNGTLAQLLERYYGHVGDFDYVGTRTYQRDIERKLPRYKKTFESAGLQNDLDWRLLAAVAYQESHWNPRAISPTGVRGIMMLTQSTARHLGVKRRTDPQQSIIGGSRYLRTLLDRIPERIKEPDRMWLALAAYNVGFGHLEDARIITQKRGGDPDRWVDVKKNLPLLRNTHWYRNTKHGYARGNEAVHYVENIRSYYDILIWSTDRDQAPQIEPSLALGIKTPAL